MAIGADKVQVLKQESSALGGAADDAVPYPAPISPQEDAIECAGVYLQDASARDSSVYIARDGSELVLKDAVGNELRLTAIAATQWRRYFLLMGA